MRASSFPLAGLVLVGTFAASAQVRAQTGVVACVGATGIPDEHSAPGAPHVPVADPVADGGSGTPLRCRWSDTDPTANRFSIYFNPCAAGDTCTTDERISNNDARMMGIYLQCAWDVFHDPRMAVDAEELFPEPLDGPWAENPGHPRVPVWWSA